MRPGALGSSTPQASSIEGEQPTGGGTHSTKTARGGTGSGTGTAFSCIATITPGFDKSFYIPH